MGKMVNKVLQNRKGFKGFGGGLSCLVSDRVAENPLTHCFDLQSVPSRVEEISVIVVSVCRKDIDVTHGPTFFRIRGGVNAMPISISAQMPCVPIMAP